MKQIVSVYVIPFRRTLVVIDVGTNSLGIFIELGRSLKKVKSRTRTLLKKKSVWDRCMSSMINHALDEFNKSF